MKTKAQKKPHYVNNRQFSEALVEYADLVNAAKAQGEEVPQITEYIGDCILRIANGVSHRPNFCRYTYREEMVSDALQDCINAVTNYKVTAETRSGKPNAYGYFTRICWNAFLRRIEKEKKQQNIKIAYMSEKGIESFVDGHTGNEGESIMSRMKSKIEATRTNDQIIKDFAREQKAK